MEGIKAMKNEPYSLLKNNPSCQLGSPKCIFSPWTAPDYQGRPGAVKLNGHAQRRVA